VAQVVVDAAGQVVIANDRARELFALRQSDVGRPLRDLPLSYRPLELRSLIERAEAERRNVGIKEIEWRTPRAIRAGSISISLHLRTGLEACSAPC
jgi:two-component system CheB/CheR fusion protein